MSYHTLYTNPAHDGLSAQLAGYAINAGWMGVPIFFVLSGFLISYPFFQKRVDNPQFWYQRGYASRRLAKILPPFYLSIILFMGFYWWQFHDPAYFKSAWMWATGLAHFMAIPVPFNLSYWSLIVEAHFYIMLPLLFWVTRGLDSSRTTLCVFAVLFLGPALVRCFMWPANLYVIPPFPDPVAIQMGGKLGRFPSFLDYFSWGVLFAGIYAGIEKTRALLRPLSLLGYGGGLLMVLLLLYWGYWENQYGIRACPTRWSTELSHWLPGLAALLLLFFVFDERSLGARFFGAAPLRFTGIISYEWFLFHGPVVNWFKTHGSEHANGNVLIYAWKTFLPLALTFGFSVLVYRYFSLPILNRVRQSLRR